MSLIRAVKPCLPSSCMSTPLSARVVVVIKPILSNSVLALPDLVDSSPRAGRGGGRTVSLHYALGRSIILGIKQSKCI